MPLCRPLLNAKICSNHCLIVNFSGKNEISNVKPNANYYQSRSMKKGVSREKRVKIIRIKVCPSTKPTQGTKQCIILTYCICGRIVPEVHLTFPPKEIFLLGKRVPKMYLAMLESMFV